MRGKINISNKFECSGCGVCVVVCPKHCLRIEKDNLGFSVPELKEDDCIGCGRCLNVCPQQNKRDFIPTDTFCFYGQSKDINELKQSSSGGYFSIIARHILNKGGKVWGVAVDCDGKPFFHCVEDISVLWRLRGSKYVEVTNPLPYDKIHSQLDNGDLVMVSGLPCQIRAFHNYIGKREYPNLLMVDLLCYGIQSPVMWRTYLSEINKQDKPIKNIFMRNKRYSWYDYSMYIEYQDGELYKKIRWYDDWLLSYSRSVFNRESCTCCESKKFPRISDFTIGDFWDVGRVKCKFNKKNGISIIFANTSLAKKIANETMVYFDYEILSNDIAKDLQKKYSTSIPFHKNREEFITKVMEDSFSKARDMYLEKGVCFRFKKRLNNYKSVLKRIISKWKQKYL